jgi:hypothetical protein
VPGGQEAAGAQGAERAVAAKTAATSARPAGGARRSGCSFFLLPRPFPSPTRPTFALSGPPAAPQQRSQPSRETRDPPAVSALRRSPARLALILRPAPRIAPRWACWAPGRALEGRLPSCIAPGGLLWLPLATAPLPSFCIRRDPAEW